MIDRLQAVEAEASILGSMMVGEDLAAQVVSILRKEMFVVPAHRMVFEALAGLYARDVPIDMVTLADELVKRGTFESAGGYPFIGELLGRAFQSAYVEHHAQLIKKAWQARSLAELCRGSADYLESKTYFDGGKRLADKLATKALGIFSENGKEYHQERADVLDELFLDTMEDGRAGIALPWDVLNDEMMGPLVGGEVVGMSAFSGGGKSTMAANIVAGLCSKGIPCIVFATEMGKRWLARMAAARSVTSQWRAEKGKWDDNPVALRKYQQVLEKMKAWPLEVVTVANITPHEVINRTRILRQRYLGQNVLVVVDHLHRLDYGGKDPNKMVGWATRLTKNFAMDDGKLVFLNLYQPRKPEDLEITWKPVAFHQVRGDALVGNELDTHISPFRTWVKTNNALQTPWGSFRAVLNERGLPVVVAPPDPGALDVKDRKLSDEHVFIKVDKRRIGGPGKTVVLSFYEPAGLVTDKSLYDEHQQVVIDLGGG